MTYLNLKASCIAFVLFLSFNLFSQSTDMAEIRQDGIQIPVVDHMQVNNPVKGLLVYDEVNGTPGYLYYDGSQWLRIGTGLTDLVDEDGDTRVTVEAFPDSDEITFDLNSRTVFELQKIPNTPNFRFRVPEFNDGNILFGHLAGASLAVTADRNTVLGQNAGELLSTGSNNVYIGQGAANQNGTGSDNVMVGQGAGEFAGDISSSVFIGHRAGLNSKKGSNTYIGVASGELNDSGEGNTSVGNSSGYANTSGNYNVSVGLNAGGGLDGGSFNVYLGESAGFQHAGGDGNTFLGNRAGTNLTGGSNNIFIGAGAGDQYTTVDNTLVIGKNNGANPLVLGDFTTNTVRINDVLQLPPLDIGATGVVVPTCASAADVGKIYLDSSSAPEKLKICITSTLAPPAPAWLWQNLN